MGPKWTFPKSGPEPAVTAPKIVTGKIILVIGNKIKYSAAANQQPEVGNSQSRSFLSVFLLVEDFGVSADFSDS